jgi:hypothetical protein
MTKKHPSQANHPRTIDALAGLGPSTTGSIWVPEAKTAAPVYVTFEEGAGSHAAQEMLRQQAKALAPAAGQPPAKAQADDLSRIIGAACDLVDLLLGSGADVSLPLALVSRLTRPVTDKMRAYLDRRGKTSEDPWWVSKMRATVTKSDEKNVQSVDDTVFEVK